jgi:hypothetical protein
MNRQTVLPALLGAERGVIFAGLLLAAGCGGHGGGSNRYLLDKATHDLQCPRDSITVMESGKLRDVEGCGRRASYAWTGHAWVPSDQQPTTYGQPGPVIVYPGQPNQPNVQQAQYVQQPGTQYVQQPGQQPGTPYVQQPGTPYVQQTGGQYVQQPPAPTQGQAPPPSQYQGQQPAPYYGPSGQAPPAWQVQPR